jgi:NADH:ubiquinone oxidoreductase subunit 4 (subunit M)
VTRPENEHLSDLNARELATLVPLVALCFWIGVYPKPFLEFLYRPARRVAAIVQPAVFGAQAVHAATADPPAPTTASPAALPPGPTPVTQ